MSKYTTGELAKYCNVSVRTVQYYDSRGILIPSELSEGGRRIYTEEDAKRMKIICFLRELDLPINSIKELLEEEHPEKVISILLEEQGKELRADIAEKQGRLEKVEELQKILKDVTHFSVESIGDVAYIMENRKALRKVHRFMIMLGIIMDVIEVLTFIYGLKAGIWWPFAVGMCVVVAIGAWTCIFYYKKIAYICPQCHAKFIPVFRQMFWARHTASTRKLTCTSCGYHGFCVEVARKNE